MNRPLFQFGYSMICGIGFAASVISCVIDVYTGDWLSAPVFAALTLHFIYEGLIRKLPWPNQH